MEKVVIILDDFVEITIDEKTKINSISYNSSYSNLLEFAQKVYEIKNKPVTIMNDSEKYVFESSHVTCIKRSNM